MQRKDESKRHHPKRTSHRESSWNCLRTKRNRQSENVLNANTLCGHEMKHWTNKKQTSASTTVVIIYYSKHSSFLFMPALTSWQEVEIRFMQSNCSIFRGANTAPNVEKIECVALCQVGFSVGVGCNTYFNNQLGNFGKLEKCLTYWWPWSYKRCRSCTTIFNIARISRKWCINLQR